MSENIDENLNSNGKYLFVSGVTPLKKTRVRTAQFINGVACRLIPWKSPKLLPNYDFLVKKYKEKGKKHILIVADKSVYQLGLLKCLLDTLNKAKIKYSIFTDINPNPTITNINNGRNFYFSEKCDSIIAIGGGSAMDAGKSIGILVTNNKPINKYKGLFKVRHPLPLLSAIPTTCGTGSETTLAAVILDDATGKKYPIESNRIVPSFTLLDVNLIRDLPKSVFAQTGMDALTHAIEAYLNNYGTHKTRQMALKAINIISQYIQVGYFGDIHARSEMLKASYLAGKAFNRAMVGNCHAIAHAIGGKYNLPHGYLNAIILPVILTTYYTRATSKLDVISKSFGVSSGNEKKQNAINVIERIQELNRLFGLPSYIEQIKDEDIPQLAQSAYKEAVPLYPTPLVYSYKDFERVIKFLQTKRN